MIITFYSYKGGVGRTQLLANLAAYFCNYTNKKILLIDWDLEAPGLHYYFDKSNVQQKGLIELLMNYCDRMERNDIETEQDSYDFLEQEFQQHIISSILVGNSPNAQIDLMTAGQYDQNYSKKISDFDWQRFYKNLDGGVFIEIFKRFLKKLNYEFIFIDSRTGLNDYSGICNIQMPDANIVVIAPNEQNIKGSADVIKRITESDYIAKYKQRKALIFPILSRLDTSRSIASSKWITRFKEELKPILENITVLGRYKKTNLSPIEIQEDITEYIDKTTLFYDTDMSYGESVQFNHKLQTIENLTLLGKMENIANLLLAFQQYPIIESDFLPLYHTKASFNKNHKPTLEKLLETIKKSNINQETLKDKDINNAILLLEAMARPSVHLGNLAQELAIYFENKYKLDEAIEFYKTSINIYEKIEDAYIILATCYNNIGGLYYQKGNLDLALEYCQKALDIQEKVLGREHTNTATSYNNIGLLYKSKGDLDWALDYYQKALAIQEKVLGTEHTDTAISYNNIGTLYYQKGDLDRALDYFQKALDIREKLLGTEHTNTATSYNNIGNLYQSKGDLDKALGYFEKALDICEKVLGREHTDTGVSYNNIGHLYYKQGDFDTALNFIQKAYNIFKNKLGDEHSYTKNSYKGLQIIQAAIQERENDKNQ